MGADKNSGLSFQITKIANSHSVNYTKILNHNKLTSKLSNYKFKKTEIQSYFESDETNTKLSIGGTKVAKVFLQI